MVNVSLIREYLNILLFLVNTWVYDRGTFCPYNRGNGFKKLFVDISMHLEVIIKSIISAFEVEFWSYKRGVAAIQLQVIQSN